MQWVESIGALHPYPAQDIVSQKTEPKHQNCSRNIEWNPVLLLLCPQRCAEQTPEGVGGGGGGGWGVNAMSNLAVPKVFLHSMVT